MIGSPPTLQEDALGALTHLRASFGKLFASIGVPVDRAHQIQTGLGLDKKLAWRIHGFLSDEDVLAGSRHLPSSLGLDIVLKAAREHGAEAVLTEEVRAAFDAYEVVIKAHAGERTSMEMMLASLSDRVLTDTTRSHLREAFKANSYIWGAQAKVRLSTFICHPSITDQGRVDIAAVYGLHELRRIRPGLSWPFVHRRCVDDDGKIRLPLNLTPIDEQPPRDDGLPPVPLLREFCSQPVPEVRRYHGAENHLVDELVETRIGNQGVVDCFGGEVASGVGVRYQNEHNTVAEMVVRMRTTTKWLLSDVFLHKDLVPEVTPALGVYADIEGMPMAAPAQRNKLPHVGELKTLGASAKAPYTPLIPRYADMIEYVTSKLGWDIGDFMVYRVQLEYPVIPSSVSISWPLPLHPDS
ncbi:MAG: hypothetical protein ACF8MJ_12000 [Phycisphaerales bacterium JB050]